MAAVGRADASHVVVRAVGVAGILSVVVLSYHVVVILGLGQIETSLAVSYPDAELVAAQTAEHHAVVLWNAQSEELAFELLADVVGQVRAVLMLRVDEVEFHHQLASVADAEAQRVLAGIELVKSFLSFRVV